MKKQYCANQFPMNTHANTCACSSAVFPLFKDILEAWQNANRIQLKPSSVSRYQNLIDTHILPELGLLPVSALDRTTLNQFLVSKQVSGRLDGKGGLSATYIRSLMIVINSALRYGEAEGLCSIMRCTVKNPPLAPKEPQVLNAADQSRLEQVLLQNMTSEKLLIFITLYTGLRIGEACALMWEDIDLVAETVSVRQTVSRVWYNDGEKKYSELIVGSPKTRSSYRKIPICSKLLSVIKQFPGSKTDGYIVKNSNGSFISPRTFEYRYKRIMKAAGLEPVNYHALRHSFATRCIERGMDVKTLSEILGHTDASVTLSIYVHSSMELKRRQIEKLVS